MNERTVQQIRYFCQVMLEQEFLEEPLSETQVAWELGYSQAMKNVLLWIDTPGISMMPKS